MEGVMRNKPTMLKARLLQIIGNLTAVSGRNPLRPERGTRQGAILGLSKKYQKIQPVVCDAYVRAAASGIGHPLP